VGRDDGERLDSGRFYRSLIAKAQRHGHRRQAKRLYRKAARCRADARMAKSVLDSGWGMLKRMLRYKGEHDRDVCAAENIRFVGLRRRAAVRGNEFSHNISLVEPDLPVRAKYGWGACYAAT
jgi:transposase